VLYNWVNYFLAVAGHFLVAIIGAFVYLELALNKKELTLL
jgi:hypothetical protein